ncbi:response regulator transcription factor [Metabacillus halosaccharovorans]|uniref:response regulator transcription factor n=1 Tax=Metabacillus halosaccharovorans TaxID=930124 RepID=UPI002040C8AC|nr:response regulator [Metabacillus halosaccharovorans]MCM3439319.1 response regulator [Metabacillus halosaccharovorans]
MPSYLIVDDEPLIRKGVAKLISRAAPEWHVCGEAWNGFEGIEMAAELHPDLILSDIRMPEMDGLIMSKQLINQGISIPCVFLTGHDEFSYVQQAIKNHAFDYLLKPIKEADVRQLFNRFEMEYGVKSQLKQKETSRLKQYEFFLINALEGKNIQNLETFEQWYGKLEEIITLRSFVNLTIRIVNAYLLKFNIIGFEYKPIINESNALNVIKKLQEYCVSELQEAQSNKSNELIERVREWIDENIHETLSLSDVADLIHLNPTYFSEYFKKTTGEQFSQYVIRCKIERAKEFLSDYSLRVYDVAIKVGYSDQRHFSKVFQTKVGMTPTEYRNKVLGIRS